MAKPTKPVVPPPALRSDPSTFSAKAEANVLFFETLVDYMDESADYTDEILEDITAIAMAGDLPPLTGLSGKIFRVSDDELSIEFYDVGTTGLALLESETDPEAQGVMGLGDLVTYDFLDFYKDQSVWNAGTDTGSAFISAAQLAGAITALSPVKAYAVFKPVVAANLSATYARSGTTVTVTSTAHGYAVGHVVYADFTSGAATDGQFVITDVTANTFTFEHGASGTTSGNINLNRVQLVAGSVGVHSVTYSAAGQYVVNFSAEQATANYIVQATASGYVTTPIQNANRIIADVFVEAGGTVEVKTTRAVKVSANMTTTLVDPLEYNIVIVGG